jgi:hypothetical protein
MMINLERYDEQDRTDGKRKMREKQEVEQTV